jgi:transposase-like protein
MARSKSEYWLTPEGLLLIEGWARDGLTDEQIAKNMGCAYSTLRDWRDRYSAISAALKKGKEVVDRAVENALLKRALGYDYTEKRVETSASGNTKTITITKHIPGDTTAQIFWLKNRRPDLWRDKQNIEHSGQINNPFADLTTEELRKLADAE